MIKETWQEEQHLIHGLHVHDPLSLEGLVKRYSPELFNITCLILAGAGSIQDAEECLNELFVTVWQEFDSFNPARGSLRTWLMMRTKYMALDCRRHLLRSQPTGFSMVTLYEAYTLVQDQQPLMSLEYQQKACNQPLIAGVDALLEQQERYEELYHALLELPALDRFIVSLRYFQPASIQVIAVRTGLTKHAVESRLWRARKALREALQEQVHDPLVKTTEQI